MKQPAKYRTVWKQFEPNEEEDLIAIFLMQQKSLGERSDWAPYIDVVPKNLILPYMFDEEELPLIQDKLIIAKAQTRRKELKKRFNMVKERINALLDDGPDSFRSFDSYLWGHSMMGSRALSIRGKKYLVPLSDMFNYSPEEDARTADSGANFLKYHRIEEGKFKVFADRDTSKGSQAFEDYGDNPNGIYFEHHGFIPQVLLVVACCMHFLWRAHLYLSY
jgi:histone-lysine N-methyltransferase SETD3